MCLNQSWGRKLGGNSGRDENLILYRGWNELLEPLLAVGRLSIVAPSNMLLCNENIWDCALVRLFFEIFLNPFSFLLVLIKFYNVHLGMGIFFLEELLGLLAVGTPALGENHDLVFPDGSINELGD